MGSSPPPPLLLTSLPSEYNFPGYLYIPRGYYISPCVYPNPTLHSTITPTHCSSLLLYKSMLGTMYVSRLVSGYPLCIYGVPFVSKKFEKDNNYYYVHNS